jgi:hypothetical protein
MDKETEIQGRKLVCPFCAGTYFSQRSSLLNTRGLAFFDLDWANKSADNYICKSCGYIMWFIQNKGLPPLG